MANRTTPIDALLAGVKQFLAELDSADWDQLVTEVRQPDPDNKPGSEGSDDEKFVGRLFGSHR